MFRCSFLSPFATVISLSFSLNYVSSSLKDYLFFSIISLIFSIMMVPLVFVLLNRMFLIMLLNHIANMDC